jgi:hypothetical protein
MEKARTRAIIASSILGLRLEKLSLERERVAHGDHLAGLEAPVAD